MARLANAQYLHNPDLWARSAAPVLASEPIRGPDGKWHWGGLGTKESDTKRREQATSTTVKPRRRSIIHHRTHSGVDMDPATREAFRLNRTRMEFMQQERSEMMVLAAAHQAEKEREKERLRLIEEKRLQEELEKKEEEERIEMERLDKEEAERKRRARPDPYARRLPSEKRSARQQVRMRDYQASTFDKTKTTTSKLKWTPAPKVKYQKSAPEPKVYHGRTSSDFHDVDVALSRINGGGKGAWR